MYPYDELFSFSQRKNPNLGYTLNMNLNTIGGIYMRGRLTLLY